MIRIDGNLLTYAAVPPGPTPRTSNHDSHPTCTVTAHGSLRMAGAASRCGTAHRYPPAVPTRFPPHSTNPKLFERPASIECAWRTVDDCFQIPAVRIPTPTERHGQILRSLLHQAKATSLPTPNSPLPTPTSPPSPSNTGSNFVLPTATSPGSKACAGGIPCAKSTNSHHPTFHSSLGANPRSRDPKIFFLQPPLSLTDNSRNFPWGSKC